jgi:hypothetical protein
VTTHAIRQWDRPAYLDELGAPPFLNEKYLFEEDVMRKHFDLRDWAGRQIAMIMQAALDELAGLGLTTSESRDALMSRLREGRRREMEANLRDNPVPIDERDARGIGLRVTTFEGCLGVSGETIISTPDRFLRRFYGGDPWDRHLTALILDIMGAEGEGYAAAINPEFTFRTNRFSCGGDPFDEWAIERLDEESVGRHPRIPGTDFDFGLTERPIVEGRGSTGGPGAAQAEEGVEGEEVPALQQWSRPEWLDRWRKPPYVVEEYAFNTPLIVKHRDVQFWAGNQIAFLTQAAIDELVSREMPLGEVEERLKAQLKEHFRRDALAFLEERPPGSWEANARTAGHLFMRWEGALGVAGEIMVNTPERFLRRFYDPGDWYRFASPAAARVMLCGVGEGIASAVRPDLTYRVNRLSCAGDPFDEWVIEPKDETSDGRGGQE